MSYLDKTTSAVINARLTDRGRELLSRGQLNFTSFRVGDSEIDYSSLGTTFDITLGDILRAKPAQPELKTPLLPSPNSTTPSVDISSSILPTDVITVSDAPELGFFMTGSSFGDEFVAYTSDDYVLRDDAVIYLNTLHTTASQSQVNIRQSPSYNPLNIYEPKIGDYMLVQMNNPDFYSVNGDGTFVGDVDRVVPYLWFKIENIISGTFAGNDLLVELDRNFANFGVYVGLGYAIVSFYPGKDDQSNPLNGTYPFINGLYSNGNVWNCNNVWSNHIAGVWPSLHESIDNYGSATLVGSKEYYGYTSEMDNLKKSISVIHYTNSFSCENNPETLYGQQFYVDTLNGESPMLHMPTLMWHKRTFPGGSGTGDMLGMSFSGSGLEKFVTLSNNNTDIPYYDLVDVEGNEVGRIFHTLQTFTIHDEELVAAMSYKSNRSWTLPTLEYTIPYVDVDGILGTTEELYVTYILETDGTGYTSGLHAQNYVRISDLDNSCAGPGQKMVNLTLPSGEFPYMRGESDTTGTGWWARKFSIIAQVVPYGDQPDPEGWKIMDYTNDLVPNGHVLTQKIDPNVLESSVFSLTWSRYNSAPPYFVDSGAGITIPLISEPNKLQFGDERFFFGNVTAKGVDSRFRTLFRFAIPPTQYNTSQNPTWLNSGQNVHISEVGIYSTTNSGEELVAIAKTTWPIEKGTNASIVIDVAMDF